MLLATGDRLSVSTRRIAYRSTGDSTPRGGAAIPNHVSKMERRSETSSMPPVTSRIPQISGWPGSSRTIRVSRFRHELISHSTVWSSMRPQTPSSLETVALAPHSSFRWDFVEAVVQLTRLWGAPIANSACARD